MSTRRLDVESVAEGLLELLESRGVRCFFGGGASKFLGEVLDPRDVGRGARKGPNGWSRP